MDDAAKRRGVWIPGLAALILVVIVVWGFAMWHSSATGDPGGKVMNQLTPTVSALPGYGTGAIPWAAQIPQSNAPYAIKDEPFQDACDGMAGTQGWSQVVVQAGFRWDKSERALVSYMEPRLAKLGWAAMVQTSPSNPPGQIWFKTLSNGARASLSINKEGSSSWELVAVGKPIGKAASGC
jgi:hypothetical protein